jgi:hypothetical protein
MNCTFFTMLLFLFLIISIFSITYADTSGNKKKSRLITSEFDSIRMHQMMIE